MADSTTDLGFLREMQSRLKNGIEKMDPVDLGYALQMVEDWIHELEGQANG